MKSSVLATVLSLYPSNVIWSCEDHCFQKDSSSSRWKHIYISCLIAQFCSGFHVFLSTPVTLDQISLSHEQVRILVETRVAQTKSPSFLPVISPWTNAYVPDCTSGAKMQIYTQTAWLMLSLKKKMLAQHQWQRTSYNCLLRKCLLFLMWWYSAVFGQLRIWIHHSATNPSCEAARVHVLHDHINVNSIEMLF